MQRHARTICTEAAPEALFKKDVLKKFANLTGKNLCFTPATLLKRDFNTDVFL